MARQIIIPGYGQLMEDTSRQWILPGYGQVMDTTAAASSTATTPVDHGSVPHFRGKHGQVTIGSK